MPTDTQTTATERPARSLATSPKTGRTILVATDDTTSSEPALRLALALAERGAQVHALHVVDTRPVPIPPPIDLAMAFADAAYGDAFREQRENELRAALSAALDRPIEWPIRVGLGTPAHAIVREAQRVSADLVVLGLRRHNVVDRVTDDETTLHVMRTSQCPVIGVTPPLTGLPRRVMVAVDFSKASLDAARAADRLIGKDGTLILAYVAPADVYMPDDGERVIHELGVTAAFAWFRAELGRTADAPTEDVVLHRVPTARVAETLLTYADGARIDMIALGAMRHGRVERWILGSVTTDVARDGSRSMLVVPQRDTARA
jgi:nucleotide-binding universal stress UspA family protein